MVNLAQIERAHSYLDAQINHSGGPRSGRAALPFITISREAGSGGSQLAAMLRDRLNANREPDSAEWTVFDRNIVDTLLADKHLSPRLARFLPEDRISEISAAVGEIVGLHPSLWTLLTETNAMLRRFALMGHVILVGRGSTFATAGLTQGVHLRTIGSHLGRAERAARDRGLTVPVALAQNRKADAAAQKYVRSLFDADIADPHAYDLIVNTDRFSAGEAADHVMAIVQARQRELASTAPMPAPASVAARVTSEVPQGLFAAVPA